MGNEDLCSHSGFEVNLLKTVFGFQVVFAALLPCRLGTNAVGVTQLPRRAGRFKRLFELGERLRWNHSGQDRQGNEQAQSAPAGGKPGSCNPLRPRLKHDSFTDLSEKSELR